jgi:hypothetical protein
MKAYGKVEVQLHSFQNSALDVSGQLHAPAALSCRKQHTVSIQYNLQILQEGDRNSPTY